MAVNALNNFSKKMLFLGDISVHDRIDCKFDSFWHDLRRKVDFVLANLEGAISNEKRNDIVCNSTYVLEILKKMGVGKVILANNHFFDDSELFHSTLKFLQKYDIDFTGAGPNKKSANKCVSFSGGEQNCAVFAFGWDVIGCKNATEVEQGVNPLLMKHLFENIKSYRKTEKNDLVIYVFHWNFELELYPQPMYRQLARDLIDAGVDAIIGTHPHVVHGAELYKGKPIIYSLGNWFFPPRKLGKMFLRFPEISNRQLALELELKERKQIAAKFHWFQFNPDDYSISLEATEDWSGKILQELTPFREMSHEKYCKWFEKNRRKSFFLPIYYDYNSRFVNKFKDFLVKLRQLVIRFLLKCRLKNSPN